MALIGSKASVWKGHADMTAGRKTKRHILRIRQKDGTYRYVFKSRHAQGKKALQRMKRRGVAAPKFGSRRR